MRHLLLLCVFLGGCTTGPVFSVADRAGLGAYLAFQVVANGESVPPAPPQPDSGACEECGGSGEVGDGVVMVTCSVCNGTGRKTSSAPVAEPPKTSTPAKKSTPVVSSGPKWNVAGNWNYTTLELADHLRRVHGVNINGRTREELEAMHNALHNGQPVPSFAPAPGRSTRSCPNGNCPIR